MDGAICRCGFTIDHGDLVATRARFVGADERAAAMRQAGRFTPIPQAEPGIRTSSDFGALSMVSWCRRSEGLLPGTAESIDAAARTSAKIHGLDVQAQEPAGAALMVPRAGGHIETIKRHVMYGLAPWGRLDECATEMVMAIAAEYGPGKLWVLNGVVHPISDDGGVSVSDVGGVPHVWLRSVCFHDPVSAEQVNRCPWCRTPLTKAAAFHIAKCQCGFAISSTDMDIARSKLSPADHDYHMKQHGALPRAERARTLGRSAVSCVPAIQPIQVKLNETVWRINAALGHVVTLQNVSGSSAGTVTIKADSASVPPQNRISLTTTDEDIGHAARSGIPMVASATGQANQVWPRSFRTLPDGRVETEWSGTEVAREDVTYDNEPLSRLLRFDEKARRENVVSQCARSSFTTLQRDAVSAYHSDQLRAKLKASGAADKARETSVVVDMEDL